jgi:hypothetical protein
LHNRDNKKLDCIIVQEAIVQVKSSLYRSPKLTSTIGGIYLPYLATALGFRANPQSSIFADSFSPRKVLSFSLYIDQLTSHLKRAISRIHVQHMSSTHRAQTLQSNVHPQTAAPLVATTTTSTTPTTVTSSSTARSQTNKAVSTKRGRSVTTPLSDHTNVEVIDEDNEDAESSTPEKRCRAAAWSHDEIVEMLKAIYDYAKEHGLPASTKPSQAQSAIRSNSKTPIPVGWKKIASTLKAGDRDALQVLRKFDNVKSETTKIFEYILERKSCILLKVALRWYFILHGRAPNPEERDKLFAQLERQYNIKTNHPPAITFVVEDETVAEPWEEMHTAIIEQLVGKLHGAFYFDDVAPLLKQINDAGAPLHLSKKQAKKSNKRPLFQLKDTHHADMERSESERNDVDDTDDVNDDDTDTDRSVSKHARRRRRTASKPDDSFYQESIKAIATSATNLENILQTAMIKPIHEKFDSLAELLTRIHATKDDTTALLAMGVRETYDLVIIDAMDIKNKLNELTYKRLRALTYSTNLRLPE